MVSLTFDILAVQIVLWLEKGRLVQVWGNMFTLICLILCFGKRIVFQTLVSMTRKLNFEKVIVFKEFSENRFSSSGFHSESLTAILCWGGCLSALSLLSKVKTGPK